MLTLLKKFSGRIQQAFRIWICIYTTKNMWLLASRSIAPLNMEGSLSCHTIMNRRDLGSHTLTQRSAYYDRSGVLLTYTHPNPRENLIKEEDSTPTTLGHPPPPSSRLANALAESEKGGFLCLYSIIKHRTEKRQVWRGHIDMITCTVILLAYKSCYSLWFFNFGVERVVYTFYFTR